MYILTQIISYDLTQGQFAKRRKASQNSEFFFLLDWLPNQG